MAPSNIFEIRFSFVTFKIFNNLREAIDQNYAIEIYKSYIHLHSKLPNSYALQKYIKIKSNRKKQKEESEKQECAI